MGAVSTSDASSASVGAAMSGTASLPPVVQRRIDISAERPKVLTAEAVQSNLALAHGGQVPEGYGFPFRGCLVHYEGALGASLTKHFIA